MFEVITTAENVVKQGRHVQIRQEVLKGFSQELLRNCTPMPEWDAEHHFQGGEEETVAYLLAVDTINFCFWPPQGKKKWRISYGGKDYSGYYGLSVSLRRALESGIPITNASFLASLTLKRLKDMLAGAGVLQLLEERLLNLQQMGRVLGEKYNGGASELVAAAGGSAIKLVRMLETDLSSFRDQAMYRGQQVFFYKRAQLFAADLHSALGGKGLGSFRDIQELTAFADYKLPQVLRHRGVLAYSPALAEKVDRMIPLEPGSEEEVEIRAHTIWAVELIRQEMKRLGKEMHASAIDLVLWNLGQDDEYRTEPYHRTVSIFY